MKRTLFSILSLLTLTACNGTSVSDLFKSDADSTENTEVVENETAESETAQNEAVESEDVVAEGYETMDSQLRKEFAVKGTPNIKSFAQAIEPVTYDLLNAEEGEKVLDEKNGFFSFYEEGAGSARYNMAYWNRKDGSKMFIVSYCMIEEVFATTEQEKKALTAHKTSEWYYYDSAILNSEGNGMRYDMGYMAYLYDEAGKKLVPMKTSPFNGAPQGEPVFYNLPRQGKDIEATVGMYGDNESSHKLQFNGMTFDYMK